MNSEPTLTPEFKAFKDGVYDAVIHGEAQGVNNGPLITIRGSVINTRHYYKRGYDFGMTLLSDMEGEEE